jgi:uncharacterized protein with FMN-binding domain
MRRKLKNIAAVGALGLSSLVFGVRAASAATQAAPTGLKDGTYTGKRANAFYRYVRVKAVVSGGKLTDVVVLEYPANDPRSRVINTHVLPYLVQGAVSEQDYTVDFISGATLTCRAFMSSLQDALKAAGA